MLLCIQQWLNLVLDLVVTAIVVILLVITTSLREKFSGGAIGVALNLVVAFNQAATRTIHSWTEQETSIGAVSRIQNFQRYTPSEETGLGMQDLPVHTWPSDGVVILENVSAAYQ